mgnify:CR=1 FL=1
MASNENIQRAMNAVIGPMWLTTSRPFALVVNFGIRPIGNHFVRHATTENPHWNASNISQTTTPNRDRVWGPENHLAFPVHRRRLRGRTNVVPNQKGNRPEMVILY